MNTENEELVFDEDDAIKFILNFIPDEDKGSLTDDDVQYVLDVIYDYYEEKGLIDEDTAESATIDEEDMLNFVRKAAKKDKIDISDVQIQLILEGEFEYGVSIGIYDAD